ncbi:uncharacterized protein LOC103514267 [Diaphorina citri]|uniref:Uncharacterized protein LOC103514267 n=1 Tax=Diaphorina citri TaxID=121845 RepID=A0A3Q0J3N2_DIACI|nr:uncharacterized protein LOC103514267 [Diaphorina citri]
MTILNLTTEDSFNRGLYGGKKLPCENHCTFTYVSDWTKFATEVHDLEVEFINPNRKNFKKKHRSKTDCSGVTNVPIDHQLIKQFESKIEEMRKVHKEEFSELESKVSALFSKVELLQQRLQNCAAFQVRHSTIREAKV